MVGGTLRGVLLELVRHLGRVVEDGGSGAELSEASQHNCTCVCVCVCMKCCV